MQGLEKIPKINKRRAFNKAVGLGKKIQKIKINLRSTSIPEFKVIGPTICSNIGIALDPVGKILNTEYLLSYRERSSAIFNNSSLFSQITQTNKSASQSQNNNKPVPDQVKKIRQIDENANRACSHLETWRYSSV